MAFKNRKTKPIKYYPLVEKFVIDAFAKAGREHDIPHFKRTVFWAEKLNPEADEAMLVAAVAHDIERAYRSKANFKRIEEYEKGFKDDFFLKIHPHRGARIIEKFLRKKEANEDLIKRVKMLIEKHELGGNDDQNLLKDADSVSYFENNALRFVERQSELGGKRKVKAKLNWMYRRITSAKAREIAEPWYSRAIKRLG